MCWLIRGTPHERFAFSTVAILALALTGCGFAPTGVEPGAEDAGQAADLAIQRLVVEPSEVTIHLADSVELVAYGLTAGGDTATVELTWTTTDGTVKGHGKGNGKGRYTGSKPGKNHVVATDSSGVADTVEVTVSDPVVARVDVSPSAGTLAVGATLRLVATPIGEDGEPLTDLHLTWTTADPAIAGVDPEGLVTGLASGSVLISAAAGGQSGSAAITVETEGGLSDVFSCLDTAADVQLVTGHHEEKLDPDAAAGRAFDGRTADFVVRETHGVISVGGDSGETGMCWAGGFVSSDKPWDASWDDHKDPDGPTRNSAAISNSAHEMTITGLHYFNVHDGARTNNAYQWLLQHSWGEYVRDDCIENDHLHSGRIYDTLFDGCYTGISTAPSSDDTVDGTGEVVELDRVLLRMAPMPYPYKWEEKSGVIGVDGEPYDGTGIPYGHGDIFKLEDDDLDRNPRFAIRNSVFLLTHYTKDSKANFPPPSLMIACENVTIIWLGGGEYPGELPTSKFPGCFTLLTGQEGIDYWVDKVSDWHARHPQVGANRKPSSPGSLEFPRKF